MSRKKLVPTTHILHSKRNRSGFGLEGAVMELCDNSLDHGGAETIYVTIDRGAVTVRDDGIGVADINPIFHFGASSAYDDRSKNSQFGIGATDAATFLGDHLKVTTVHHGRLHSYAVDWGRVEKSGEWPDAYTGRGEAFKKVDAKFPLGQGTEVVISKLHERRTRMTVEKLIVQLGRKFAPALRAGRKIHVTYVGGSEPLSEWVEPYEPPVLDPMVEIRGEFETKRGTMRWSGLAGLSEQLRKEDNMVHLVFGHRVIESTRSPFKGVAAGTLWVEVELEAEDGWKYALSDHKDKIVRYREELFDSIHARLGDLLKQAEDQAHYVSLRLVTAPIEQKLTKALRGAGVLHVDPDEEPEHGEGQVGPGPKKPRVRNPVDEGDSAKPAKAPTGVHVEYKDRSYLDGKLWDWNIDKELLVVYLLEEHFKPVFGFPPDARDWTFINTIIAFLAHGVEMEYWDGDSREMLQAFKPALRRRIEEWAGDRVIAPKFHAAVMRGLEKVE